MQHLRNSLKDLVKVNPHAGYLRLGFMLISVFILWSVLAMISAVFNPLGSLNLHLIPDLSTSNLAVSLLMDILQAYSSAFTICCLALFIYIFYICFETIAVFCFRLNPQQPIKNIKAYLTNCAFSIPQKDKLNLPNDSYLSGKEKTLSVSEGPFNAVVKPGYALFIKKHGKIRPQIIFGGKDNKEVFLDHQDKVIDIYNIAPVSISLHLENNMEDIFQSPFINVELTYFYDFSHRQDTAEQFSNLFQSCDSNSLRPTLDRIISLEIKRAINQYSQNSFNIGSPSENHPQKIQNTTDNKFTFNQHSHTPDNYSFHFKKNLDKNAIRRNRKRLVYVSPGFGRLSELNEKKIHSENMTERINEILKVNFLQTMDVLFGTKIISVKIISISEQK